MSNFITRFAPSPTGYLHIGNLRTAIIAWIYAKKNNGQFILRIDDTDLQRSKLEYENQIKEDLKKCGLFWDLEYHQSKRNDIYLEYIDFLKQNNYIYECFETKDDLDLLRKTASNMKKNFIYDRTKSLNIRDDEKKNKKPYYRFKLNHNNKISWDDEIKGQITFDPNQISDPVIIREDGSFTYLLISVIDDLTMNVSHIIRGEDHISNTASQIQMFEAFHGFKNHKKFIPKFAHLPLLKMPEGKISKRIGGFEICNLLRDHFIMPITLINYLMTLGSNISGSFDEELDLEKLIEKFNLKSYGSASPNYNPNDLERLNIKNIKILEYESLKKFLLEKNILINPPRKEYWEIFKNNIEKVEDIIFFNNLDLLNSVDYINFLKENIEYKNFLNENKTQIILNIFKDVIKNHSSILDLEKAWVFICDEILKNQSIKDHYNKKDIFLCLRKFLTGLNYGPDMNSMIKFFGYQKILNILCAI